MRPSLTRLRRRAGEAADEIAAGRAVPAGVDPAEDDRRDRPSARERGGMRRRARQLRRRREAMLLELGALVFEMHRRGRSEPKLIERKADEVRIVDDEERALSAALDRDATTIELVHAGVAGPCPSCGLLVGTEARFCERCGAELAHGRKRRAANGGGDDGQATRESPRAEGAAPETTVSRTSEPS